MTLHPVTDQQQVLCPQGGQQGQAGAESGGSSGESGRSNEALLRTARQIQRLQHDALDELGLPGGDIGVQTEIPMVVDPDSFAAWFLDVMAAVTATPRPVPRCTVSTLGAMRYRAVANPAVVTYHGGVEGTLATLDEVPVLVFDRTDDLQHRFVREHLGRELTLPIHYVSASTQYTEALLQDLGWGLLTDPFSRQELDRGTLVELAPGVDLTVPRYWQRWRIDSQLMDLVTRAVERAASRVLLPIPRDRSVLTGAKAPTTG